MKTQVACNSTLSLLYNPNITQKKHRPSLATLIKTRLAFQSDPLQVRHSTATVVLTSQHVQLNPKGIAQTAQRIKQHLDSNQPILTSLQFATDHPTPQLIFILDVVNYCFWAAKNQPQWQIEHPPGHFTNGWEGLTHSFQRALIKNPHLLDAQYLANITLQQTHYLFHSSNRTPIPLLETRHCHLRQAGQQLLKHFDGNIINLIKKAKHQAPRIASLTLKFFPSFRDTAPWKNQTVRFYKRAQIFAYDLSLLPQLDITHTDQLTIFADYKLPQLLLHLNAITYSQPLSNKIDNYQEIPAHSQEEIEIRANTIWACELIAQQLNLPPCLIDNVLWSLSHQTNMKPYHRTPSTFY